MSELKKYHPVDASVVSRFCGIRSFMRLPQIQTTEDVDFAIIGAPADTGSTFRTGQRFGPAAIREMSMMLRAASLTLDIDIFKYISGIDWGDVNVSPCNLAKAHDSIENGITEILDGDVIPICLGGDHSITLPELRAVAKKYGPVALVHFDAHLDTYDIENGDTLTHGTPFYLACKEGLIDVDHSIQIGIRGLFNTAALKVSEDLGFKVITAKQMREIGLEETSRQINERVGDQKAFLTFDIDFLDPAYAPGTGTIEVGGFTSYESLKLLRETKNINYVGMDIVEVLPTFDPTQITAYMGGCIVHEFLAMLAYRRKKEIE
ncbi:MAG: agmatinase [Dethiosulfatibacter sp.]|nr:agmatinase [Dethiosulfatibacter sp.]